MIASLFSFILLTSISIFGSIQTNLNLDLGGALVIGNNIKDASPGPSLDMGINLLRFPGLEEGLGVSYLEGKCLGDTLYRYLDLYTYTRWETKVKKIYPFREGLAGASRWWVLKNGKVVAFTWGDKYQATSFLLGGGAGLKVPTKRGNLEFLVKGRFLFSQNQQRFGLNDANEGSIGFYAGYIIKL